MSGDALRAPAPCSNWAIGRSSASTTQCFFTSTEPFPVSYCTKEVLEDIFRRYNGGNLPAHFCPEYFAEGYAENWPSGAAYGLSVGDIVVLTDTYPREDLQEGAWFVDRVGFWYLGARISDQFEV